MIVLFDPLFIIIVTKDVQQDHGFLGGIVIKIVKASNVILL